MFPCELKEQDAQPTLYIHFTAPVGELAQHFGRVYGAIMAYLSELGVTHTGAAFAKYHNMDMQALEIDAGFPVSRVVPGKGDIQAGEVPGGMYAICHYTGPYDKVGVAYETLTDFVQDKGFQPAGAVYEWYLNGPDVPPQELKTDVTFPVMRVGEDMKA